MSSTESKYQFSGSAAGFGSIYGSVTFADGSARLNAGGRKCDVTPTITKTLVAMDCQGVRITLDRIGDTVATSGRAWVDKPYAVQVPSGTIPCVELTWQAREAGAMCFPGNGQTTEQHTRSYTAALRVTRVDSSAAPR